MEAIILNKDLVQIGIIDTYKSFIWTDRYAEAGDFEIKIPATATFPNEIQKGYYLWNENSEHVMIVETIQVESDVEEGACFIITGRSLESLLTRRIVWNKKVFSGVVNTDSNGKQIYVKPNLQNGIKTLLEENVINPALDVRKIPNFIFEESTDEKITSLTFEAEYLGDEIYTVVNKLCVENEIGFKVTLNDNNQFVFKLYAGVDRSYGTDDEPQFVNPYVVFSPNNENIINTSYIDSDSSFKNITLVVGESEYDEDGNEISRVAYELGSATGLERREIFTDATSLSFEDEDGGVLTGEQYQALLKQKGIDTLMEHTSVTAFDGEIEAHTVYKYGVDFFVGDIVQMANEYGHEGRAYISELVMSCEAGGTSIYPTFQTIQKGVYET